VLAEIIPEAAGHWGDRPAMVAARGWTLSYAELHQISDEVAAGLAGRGVDEGDVVGLCLPSTPDYLVAYAAVAKVGAVTAGVNPGLAPAERAAVLGAVAPALTVATTDLLPPVERGKVLEVEAAAQADDILAPLRQVGGAPPTLSSDPDRAVAIVFTSGTTGMPKGAVFRNRELAAIEEMDTAGRAGWGAGVDSLAATQFAHVGTMTKIGWQLRTGTTTHLLARWRAGDALRKMAELRVPAVAGVPPQIALMLRDPEMDRHDWDHVQAIVAGGGPVTPALVEEATNRFGAPMSVRYSSTESGGVGCGTALDAPPEEALFTVGRPRGDVELAIRDDDGRAVAPGEVGEVCFRSRAACAGYWNDPDASAALRWPDGFVRMGDLGAVVVDGPGSGCLRLAGRSNEMFVRGGYNVHPMEVEAILAAHPGVREVAVVPRPDPVMGEIGVAVVVPVDPREPPSLDDLRGFAVDLLAKYKLPEAIAYIDELPLTAMQKLDRATLTSRHA
jgi:acyl-CoA synthetase (AMP-forming)/AMP-acid ligase II